MFGFGVIADVLIIEFHLTTGRNSLIHLNLENFDRSYFNTLPQFEICL